MKIQSHLKLTVAPIALSVALASVPAWAQEPPAECPVDENGVCVPSDVLDSTAAETDDAGAVIIVTGTRVARPELQSANPVVTVSSEAIAQSGLTNVTELLAQTPALFGSETNFDAAGSQARFGGAGVNLLDLRYLGPQRTLVLVNGRRHIAGVPGEAAVDINTIPLALIDRVDVLTGGVSAIYGADAVSGVVNFVMKDDFEGIDIRAQNGFPDSGKGDSHYLAATVGTNFADNRGNIAASYEFRFDERIAFADRPIGRPDALRIVRNPGDIPDDPDIPDNILLGDLRYSDSSPDSAVIIDTSLVPVFRGGGQPYDLGIFLPESGFLAQGGSSTPIAAYQGDLQAETEFHTFNLLTSYELTPSVSVFAEGKYVTSEAFTVSQPSFDFYNYVPADNPFIPANIEAAIAPGSLAGFGYPDGVFYSRDNFDLGTRNELVERDLYRFVGGVRGDISSDVQFEVSYVYGQNDTTFLSQNYRLRDRFYAALDAVDEGEFLTGVPNGNIVCRADLNGGNILTNNLLEVFDIDPSNDVVVPQTFTPGADSGCAPLNIFGEGVASQAALDFINVDLENRFTLKQHVLAGFISGDTAGFFELPGGPLGFAVGAEYRREQSNFRPDPIATQSTDYDPNAPVLQDLALLGNENGEFDVKEAFAEISLPILSDTPFAEVFEIGAAVRFSDYSTIGSTTTWKVDGTWAPIRDIRFRGSYSEAVRAPNITELFAPTTGAFSFLSDPCSPVNISSGTEFRESNCRALIEGLGVDFDTFDFESSIEASASLLGRATGNPDLEEETAKTWTAGVVVQPRFLSRLSISFDWYDIRLENAINTATLEETAEFCVDSPTLDNVFCDNITRSPVTGYVQDYQVRPENVAFFETAGADITVGYSFEPGNLGTVNMRGTLGYLDKLRFLPADAGVVDDDRGEAGAPKWIGTSDITWQVDNFAINYGLNYIGDQLRFEIDEIQADPDIADPELITADSVFIHDIRAEIMTDNEVGTFYFGVNNLTDAKNAPGSATIPVGYMGRFFYVGIRIGIDDLGF